LAEPDELLLFGGVVVPLEVSDEGLLLLRVPLVPELLVGTVLLVAELFAGVVLMVPELLVVLY
jgi:hypothetical protein